MLTRLVVEFWRRVDIRSPRECWVWRGGYASKDYGRFGQLKRFGGNGKNIYAHRLAYQLLRGQIAAGLETDHLCRNHRCVNPWHLEPVTRKENMMRGIGPCADNARKTHCKRGHAFTKANSMKCRNGRQCRQCHVEWKRQDALKRRIAA